MNKEILAIAANYFKAMGVKQGLSQAQQTGLIVSAIMETLGLDLSKDEQVKMYEVVYALCNCSQARQRFEAAGLLEKTDGKRGSSINALAFLAKTEE